MAKKVLIISTSFRGGSNSDVLAKECVKGAKEAGHDVELLSLKGIISLKILSRSFIKADGMLDTITLPFIIQQICLKDSYRLEPV